MSDAVSRKGDYSSSGRKNGTLTTQISRTFSLTRISEL